MENAERPAPTVEDVFLDLVMNGAGRGALVRTSRDGGVEPGICVFMLDREAVQLLGWALFEEIKMLKKYVWNGEAIGIDIALSGLFAAVEDTPGKWMWLVWPYERMEVGAAVFVGREICERVATICNSRGVPVTLDPDRSPPGCEIERRVAR